MFLLLQCYNNNNNNNNNINNNNNNIALYEQTSLKSIECLRVFIR